MANIMTTIEVSPESGGFYVIVSMNGATISKHGPMPDINAAEAVQAEQVSIVQATLQREVQRLRERIATDLGTKLLETRN